MKKRIAAVILAMLTGVLFVYDGLQFCINVGGGGSLSQAIDFLSSGFKLKSLGFLDGDGLIYFNMSLGALVAAAGGLAVMIGGFLAWKRKSSVRIFIFISLALAAFSYYLHFSGSMIMIAADIIILILLYFADKDLS